MAVIEPIARVGFTARGAVYVVMGVLAAAAAVGQGGRTTDTHGAVREVGNIGPGGVLLIGLALGLLSYAAWRIAQAVLDLDGKGGGFKGWALRAGFLISGLVHVGLAMTAAGIGVTSGSGSVRSWVSRALAEPGGVWAVALAGAIVVGAGVYQFYWAWTAKFEDRLQVSKMSAGARTWARRVGRFGVTARGITFVIVGWFLLRAAQHVTSSEVKDVGGALRVLGAQPYGIFLLGIVACGLVSYGLLSFVEARYRQIVR
jgi:hypothetical protein